jgi:hypothetical protein
MKKDKIKLVKIEKIRFAIEIEVEFPHSKDSQKLIDRHSVLNSWEIDYDGSLSNGAEYRPKRSNHLYYNEESLTQIKEILALIKVHRGKVDKGCGLHIHINAKNFTDKQIVTIIKEFIAKQRYIIKRFEVHPDRLNSTCSLLPRENLHKLTEKQIHNFRRQTQEWSYSGYNGLLENKYLALNICHLRQGDYGTLEFRIFDGTLSYRKLKEQIYFTLSFIKEALEREQCVNPHEIILKY